MAVVCFRIVPNVMANAPATDEELNSLHRQVTDSIHKTGEAYLTHTKLNGRIAIRLAVGNVLTGERDLRKVYELLSSEAARLVSR